MKARAVYAGSFDPVTNGHLWMIREGARLFKSMVVAVGTNPDKETTFSVEERVSLINEALEHEHLDTVRVDAFHNLYLVDYARSVGAEYMLRGIRSATDYDYERVMRYINQDMSGETTTVFLMPPRTIADVSSSLVKGLIGPKGWKNSVSKYVPDNVFKALCEKFDDV